MQLPKEEQYCPEGRELRKAWSSHVEATKSSTYYFGEPKEERRLWAVLKAHKQECPVCAAAWVSRMRGSVYNDPTALHNEPHAPECPAAHDDDAPEWELPCTCGKRK